MTRKTKWHAKALVESGGAPHIWRMWVRRNMRMVLSFGAVALMLGCAPTQKKPPPPPPPPVIAPVYVPPPPVEVSCEVTDTCPVIAKPPAPFITSTLQQAASTRLGFSVKKTMMMAQRLYEAGHITYMRTDSISLSADAIKMVKKKVLDTYGEEYYRETDVNASKCT